MIQDQERLQIEEAVDCYIDKQKTSRNKLNQIAISKSKVIKWDLQLHQARQNRKDVISTEKWIQYKTIQICIECNT